MLSRWARQGWLRRVGSALTFLSSWSSLTLNRWWKILDSCAHAVRAGLYRRANRRRALGLTEQIFRDVVVYTGRRVNHPVVERHGAVYSVKHIAEDRMFGTRPGLADCVRRAASLRPPSLAPIRILPPAASRAALFRSCCHRRRASWPARRPHRRLPPRAAGRTSGPDDLAGAQSVRVAGILGAPPPTPSVSSRSSKGAGTGRQAGKIIARAKGAFAETREAYARPSCRDGLS